MRLKRLVLIATMAAFAVAGSAPANASAGTPNGAGSTLASPLVADWASGFDTSGNSVNYDADGSETGIADITTTSSTSAPRTRR